MTSQYTSQVSPRVVSKIYQEYLVPLLFEEYAADLVTRLASRPLSRVLEVACGTGVVTRRLASSLPRNVAIVATELDQRMLDHSIALETSRPVEWRQADAHQLPFDDGSFDVVVCQFGVMFFSDKPRAFAEARRVLGPGGIYLFNVWDRLDENGFADAVTAGVGLWSWRDPTYYLAKTAYNYYADGIIKKDLADAGFFEPEIATLTKRSQAQSAKDPAIGFCLGSSLRGEIEARIRWGLGPATKIAAAEVARRFGQGPVDAQMQAHVVMVER